jgi:hypothetical protein
MGKNSEEGNAIKEAVAKNYHKDAKVEGNEIIWEDENGDE